MMNKKKLLIILSAAIVGFVIFSYMMLTWSRGAAEDKVVSSSQVNQKVKNALLGSGVIELTSGEVNSLIDTVLKDNQKDRERVKEAYINIVSDKIQANAVIEIFSQKFFVRSLVKPYVSDGSLKLSIDRITVGKVTIPKVIASFFMKKALPAGMKVLDDGSIDIGSKISNLDIKDISIVENKIRIVLNDVEIVPPKAIEKSNTPVSTTPDTAVKPETPSVPKAGNESGTKAEKPATTSTTTKTTVNQDVEKTIEMLKKTNEQLYDVLEDIKDTRGKDWVNSVIAVNTKMMGDPDGDYTKDINSAKAVYKKLPADTRNQIKAAAFKNMDVAAVRYLVKVYGI